MLGACLAMDLVTPVIIAALCLPPPGKRVAHLEEAVADAEVGVRGGACMTIGLGPSAVNARAWGTPVASVCTGTEPRGR